MMKSTRGMVMLLLALLTGLAAVLVAARWVKTQTGDGQRIAVATADVEIGAKLGPETVRMMDWPSASVPPGTFTDAAALQGRVAKSAFTRGEPVLEGKLAPVGSKGGLSAVVLQGRRAMTVRVNDVVGVAGFALPGNYVDIMVNTLSHGSAGAQDPDKAISKIVLERILVLAVAQESNRDETKPKVVNAVTLELTPEQAEALDLARSVGTLSLVLRNQVDPQPVRTAGATKDTLLQNVSTAAPATPAAPRPAPAAAVHRPAPAAPRVEAPPRQCVEVIRGTSRTNECF